MNGGKTRRALFGGLRVAYSADLSDHPLAGGTQNFLSQCEAQNSTLCMLYHLLMVAEILTKVLDICFDSKSQLRCMR